MDFNLKTVLNDISEIKKSKSIDLSKLKCIGLGGESFVYRDKNAALKVYDYEDIHKNKMLHSPPEKMISTGKKGISRGLHFAPILDSSQKQGVYIEYMPFINGNPLDLESITHTISIGRKGIDTYFSDHLELLSLGFCCDYHRNNFIVTKNHINFIDLDFYCNDVLTEEKANSIATKNLLSTPHNLLTLKPITKKKSQQKPLFRELAGMTESVLAKRKYCAEAHDIARKFLKSDFIKAVYQL